MQTFTRFPGIDSDTEETSARHHSIISADNIYKDVFHKIGS